MVIVMVITMVMGRDLLPVAAAGASYCLWLSASVDLFYLSCLIYFPSPPPWCRLDCTLFCPRSTQEMNGKISREEMRTALAQRGVGAEEIEELFESIDVVSYEVNTCVRS